MSQLLNTAVRNTTWSAVGSAGSGVLGLLISAVTIRMLGMEGAGFATAVLALRAIASVLGGFGLGSAVIREVSAVHATGDSAGVRTVAGIGLAVSLATGLLGGALLGISGDAIINWSGFVGSRVDARWFCAFSGVAFAALQWSATQQAVLEGLQRYDLRSRVLVLNLAIQAVATVAVLRFLPCLSALGVVTALAALQRAISLSFACRRVLGEWPGLAWRWPVVMRLWGFSRWLYLSALAGILMAGGDRLVLVSGFGSAALPFYVMAKRFYETVHEALIGQMAYLLPMLSAGPDVREVRVTAASLDDRLRWFVASLSGWLYLGVVTMGPALLRVMISPDFAVGARIPLFVLAMTGFLHAQALVTFYAMQAQARPHLTFALFLACGGGVLPVMYMLGCWNGFDFAVTGQLWIGLCSAGFVWFLAPAAGGPRLRSVVGPVLRPALILGMGMAANAGWLAGFYGVWPLAAMGVLMLVLYYPTLCRMERPATKRVETLARAVGILAERVGGSGHWSPVLGRLVFGRSNCDSVGWK